MSKVNVSILSQTRKSSRFRDDMERLCPGRAQDIKFVQQSHNATVYQGQFDGRPAFFKAYDPVGRNFALQSIAETQAVLKRMERSGVAPLLWYSRTALIVVTGKVPGTPVITSLDAEDITPVLTGVGRWLRGYAGDKAYPDRFSTSYWTKKRGASDLSALSKADRALVQDLLDLQWQRARANGTMPAEKAPYPRDFAPWNLHWTGQEVWGFDLEGHRDGALTHAIARFCVLIAEQQDISNDPHGRSATWMAEQIRDGAGSRDDPAALLPFALGDVLFERFVKWNGHRVIKPRLRAAIMAHLAQA